MGRASPLLPAHARPTAYGRRSPAPHRHWSVRCGFKVPHTHVAGPVGTYLQSSQGWPGREKYMAPLFNYLTSPLDRALEVQRHLLNTTASRASKDWKIEILLHKRFPSRRPLHYSCELPCSLCLSTRTRQHGTGTNHATNQVAASGHCEILCERMPPSNTK